MTRNSRTLVKTPKRSSSYNRPFSESAPDFIGAQHLVDTLGHYDQNEFVNGLIDLFPFDTEDVWPVIHKYYVGTFKDAYGSYTCFPYIDQKMRFCKGKLMRFDPENLKRKKGDLNMSSIVRKLKLKSDFNYSQVFFGEHLLCIDPRWPLAIVEAEKTAILASICKRVFPDMVWLATGSKSWLNAERIARIGRRRRVILYPDADAFEQWSSIANAARREGISVDISTVIDEIGTNEEKSHGFDLADFLIREQRLINQHNGHTMEEMLILQEEAEAIRAEGRGHYRDYPID